jgi:lipid A oxidase
VKSHLASISPAKRKIRLSPTATLVCCLLALSGSVARAEINLSAFTGAALTQDNDLELHQSGGTNLTFHDVSYEGRDFETPPYYGVRILWFPGDASHWGFGAEYFHMKLYLDAGDTVSVTGSRAGTPVNRNERVSDSITSFSISHGLNYVLADVIYRWFPGNRGEDFLGRFQPYVGLGLGLTVPHVESNVGGIFHEEYQLHGPGVQGLAGVNFDLSRHWGLMFEYKFTYANLDTLEIPRGSIEITPLTHHLVAGISFRF